MIGKFIHLLVTWKSRIVEHYERQFRMSSLGYAHKTAYIISPDLCTCPSKIFLYENTNIFAGAKFIINPEGDDGKFIMKKNSGSAEGLTIITGGHQRKEGFTFKETIRGHKYDIDKTIIVEEDVWLGANVTLLAGVTVGRGATVGAGSVCIKSVPPYAVVMGNPSKVVGFNFTPEQVVEHEKALYPEEERIPFDLLQKNYEKYFINRIKDIKQFTKL